MLPYEWTHIFLTFNEGNAFDFFVCCTQWETVCDGSVAWLSAARLGDLAGIPGSSFHPVQLGNANRKSPSFSLSQKTEWQIIFIGLKDIMKTEM